MNDDYLWDKSGEPDPEIARLEGLLAPFRHEEVAPTVSRAPSRRWWTHPATFAIAAAVLGALGVATLPAANTEPWAYDGDRCTDCVLEVGTALQLDHTTTMAVADIGQLELQAGSTLALVRSGDTHVLDLREGRIDVRVNAPPRVLSVQTPHTTAVDMGCAYALDVDERRTQIDVRSGWVRLEGEHGTAEVPAGSTALAWEGGVSVPVFLDAPEALRSDLVNGRDYTAPGDLRMLLDAHPIWRPKDTLSLYHLLQRSDLGLRDRVLGTLEASADLDLEKTQRDALLALEDEAMDTLQGQLLGCCWM